MKQKKNMRLAQLYTPEGELLKGGVDRTPWKEEYPRPTMRRESFLSLDGTWEFCTVVRGASPTFGERILVPYVPQSVLSGIGRAIPQSEMLCYRRRFALPKGFSDGRVLLHFGAVDQVAEVCVNGVRLALHMGGYERFSVEITEVAKEENTVEVYVCDTLDDHVLPYGKQREKRGGMWYTPISGIWQSVWLECVPRTYITALDIKTDAKSAQIMVMTDAGLAEKGEILLQLPQGERSIPIKAGRAEVMLDEPILWSPENPHLYRFVAKVGRDRVESYFALRTLEIKEYNGTPRLCLNGKPYFFHGLLDQGYFPDGIFLPADPVRYERDILAAKELGFNMLRKHIKVEPQQYYAMCDRLGIMVIQDLPSGSGSPFDPIKAETVKRYHLQRMEMKEMMDDLQTFPSIVMGCPYNEGWTQSGEFLTHSMLDFVRRYDPTRLVNGPSGCWDWEGGHLLPKGWKWENRVLTKHKPLGECEAADTVDMHLYRGPAMFEANDRRISFLGEYGGLGHPVAGHLWKESKSGNWGYGGIEDTKTREGLEKTYLDLLEKISGMAAKGLGGAIYTQTTDVEIEINGLLTYDRKVLKFNPAVLREAHGKLIDSVGAAK